MVLMPIFGTVLNAFRYNPLEESKGKLFHFDFTGEESKGLKE